MTNFFNFIVYSNKFFCTEKLNLYYNGAKLEFDHKSLSFYDIKPGSTVYLQDMGYMLPLRLSKFCVNNGPPCILYLLREYHLDIYRCLEDEETLIENYEDVWFYQEGVVQRLATYMIFIHFGKILMETAFVHRFAFRNSPLNRTLW